MINIEPYLLKIKNRQLVVIVVPIVLGLILGGAVVVKPALHQLDRVKTDVLGLQQKVSAYLFILDGEKKIEAYKSRFTGDKTWLIEQINQSAEKAGLSILSSSPEDPKKTGEFLDLTLVRIDVEANYHQLGAFISHLESLDAYVKVLGVDINAENTFQPAASVNMGGMQNTPNRVPARQQNSDAYQISVSIGLFTPEPGAL